MRRLGLNQGVLWACVTRRKSREAELAALFVKGAPFHVPKLGRPLRGRGGVFAQRRGAHGEGEDPGCLCLNPGLLGPNSLLYR